MSTVAELADRLKELETALAEARAENARLRGMVPPYRLRKSEDLDRARPDDGMVVRVEACLRSWEDARFSKPGREAEWTRLIVRDVRAAIAAADGEVKP